MDRSGQATTYSTTRLALSVQTPSSQQSALDSQPSTVSPGQSALDSQPWTVSPRQSALDSQPWTNNPEPVTSCPRRSQYKLCKVKSKKLGDKGVPCVNLHDGRTIRYPDPNVKESDTVMVCTTYSNPPRLNSSHTEALPLAHPIP